MRGSGPAGRLSYEDSCVRLQPVHVPSGLVPPMRRRLPWADDPGPRGVHFFKARVDDAVDFSDLTLPRTFFLASEIVGAKFTNADLRESNLCWNVFNDVDFSRALLADSDLRASRFARVDFSAADLSRVDLRRSSFVDCLFSGALMDGAVVALGQAGDLALSLAQRERIRWVEEDGPEPGVGERPAGTQPTPDAVTYDIGVPLVKWLGVVCCVLFGAFTVGATVAREYEVTPVFVAFFLVGLLLVVGGGRYELSARSFTHRSLLGTFRIAWRDVVAVETGGSMVVLRGRDRQFVVPKSAWWSGREKRAAAALFAELVGRPGIVARETPAADFRMHRNVRVRADEVEDLDDVPNDAASGSAAAAAPTEKPTVPAIASPTASPIAPRPPVEPYRLSEEHVAIAFGSGALTFDDGSVRFRVEDLGPLALPSGRIVAQDPLVPAREPMPFDTTVPTGTFPVQLAIACLPDGDERVAFARVAFDARATVARWTMASFGTGDTVDEDGEYLGYPVDSGTGCFMDLATARLHLVRCDDERYSTWIIDEMQKGYRHTRSWVNFPLAASSPLNAVCFSTGWGDGGYPSFFGSDAEGRIVALVTDFFVAAELTRDAAEPEAAPG